MFDNRIIKNKRNIELENGLVTDEEKTIVKTAFNIYIFFSYLCDMKIENNAAINLFRYDVEQEET